jgi:hypothetical protein
MTKAAQIGPFGQTLAGATGAGNTVAFTAQGTINAAKGQVQ